MSQRSPRRRRAAKAMVVGVVVLQAFLLVRGLGDPHKRFAFRPFDDFDTYQAVIVRVGADGERRSVDDGTWAYDWDRLVAVPALLHPDRRRPTNGGAAQLVDLLDRSLDWVAAHTPADTETRYLEATVTVWHDGRAPETVVVRSDDRPVVGGSS